MEPKFFNCQICAATNICMDCMDEEKTPSRCDFPFKIKKKSFSELAFSQGLAGECSEP
jgi:hypothetical protein